MDIATAMVTVNSNRSQGESLWWDCDIMVAYSFYCSTGSAYGENIMLLRKCTSSVSLCSGL